MNDMKQNLYKNMKAKQTSAIQNGDSGNDAANRNKHIHYAYNKYGIINTRNQEKTQFIISSNKESSNRFVNP